MQLSHDLGFVTLVCVADYCYTLFLNRFRLEVEFKVATRSQENILRSLWHPKSLLILVSSNVQNISSDFPRFPPRDREHFFFELGVPELINMLRNYYKKESCEGL